MWVFSLDAVDQIDPEIQVNRFVTQNILKLLPNPLHQIPAMKRQNHHKTGVEKDTFHDQIKADQVLQ